ncbi:MAG: glycosyltransferase [Verrucomicrobia bacterium]|nr:glycosyltransferase [Verrucomicrobiota bacterium]
MQSDAPNIGIFCPTFLKPEMWHVYRQVVGPKRVKIHAFAFKRENLDRFPYPLVHVLSRSKLRWARRIWQKQILNSPQLASPSECSAFSKLVRANKISLLHIYFGNNGVFWLPLFRKRAIPIIVSFHGADVAVGFNTPPGQRRLQQVFEAADLLLARSLSIRQSMIAAGCTQDRIRIQRTGIPGSDFRYRPRSFPDDGRLQFLQACRLIEKKGVEITLKAYAKLLQRWPNSNLVIAGDGPLRKPLEQLAQQLDIGGRVAFTGFLTKEQLLNVYYQSHVFVHPSETTSAGDNEGIPNSLLEAMATGLGSIATRHGGIPEAIEHLQNGVLVEERDVEGVHYWMNRLAEDWQLAVDLGQRAAETISQEFDSETQIQKLESVYLELIGRAPAAKA